MVFTTSIKNSIVIRRPILVPDERLACLSLAAALILVTLSTRALRAAEAEADPAKVLNVDFNGSDSGRISPTFSGVGPLGGGVIWNGLNASFPSTGGVKIWNDFYNSDGRTQSDVQIAIKGMEGVVTMLKVSKDDPSPSILHDNTLLVDVVGAARGEKPGELSISRLDPNTNYDLVLFGRGFSHGTKFLLDGVEKQTTGVGPADIPMQEGRDYVVYRAVNSGSNGVIVVKAEGTTSGAILAGLSIAPSNQNSIN